MIPWSLLIGPATTLIERLFPDKEQQDKAKAEMMAMMYDAQAKEMDAKSKVIVAEATGESWMQRNWRPSLMFTFIVLIVNNFLLVPYAMAFGVPLIPLVLPPEMWTLLSIGVGGYIVGRSGEKIYSKKHLFNAKAFYDEINPLFNGVSQKQVDILNKGIAAATKEEKL